MEALYLRIKYLFQYKSGASAVEYSIVVALIAVAIISAVGLFGSSVKELYVKGNRIFKQIFFIAEISVSKIAWRFITFEGLAKKLYGRKPLKKILSQYNLIGFSLIYPII